MANPGRLRALGAAAVLLATAGVVVAIERQPAPSTRVGTFGRSLAISDAPTTTQPTAATVLEGEPAEAGSTSTSSNPRARTTTSTTAPPASSTVPPAPPAPSSGGSIVDGEGKGSGPHDLRGRVAYLNDSPAPSSIWSVLADGSGQRLEVACPPPTDLGGANLWWPSAPFDLSPDGRFLVRSCPVVGEDLDGMRMWDTRSDLVIQGVDGSSSHTLWRYGAGDFAWPEWSPDGSRLAVATAAGIVVMDADGTNRRTITPSEQLSTGFTLSWSPDGQQLLTSSLEVVDIATGAVSHPLYGAEPWPGGATRAGTNAFRWDGDGLWWVGDFGSVSLAREPLVGLWRLDPMTHAIARAVSLPNTDYVRVQPALGGWWACTGSDTTLQRISQDGTITETGDHAFWISVAGP
jgi:dipeptidyl aminopeptidase/acylaminoacyl peptidase